MKRPLIIIVVIVFVLVVVYLNRSYAHIYNTIGSLNLPFSQTERHYVVGAETSSSVIKIAFLGDSLTAGVGAGSLENTYPYLAAQKLSMVFGQQVSVFNIGIPSAKSADLLDYQLKMASDFGADKIIVFIGINDMHNRLGVEEFKDNLKKIIEISIVDKNNTYLVNIPYLGNFLPPYNLYFSLMTKRYNQAFLELQKDGWQVIDLSAISNQFKNDENLYALDNFHPNDAGYKVIADKIFEGIFY